MFQWNSIAFVFTLILNFAAQGPVFAAAIEVKSSSLAILTDKEGIASALAHRHIIVAGKWTGSLDLGANDPTSDGALASISSGTASVRIPVEDLIVDSPSDAAQIIPVLRASNLWTDADKLEASSSTKVRENMLDETQLDAKSFPTIEGQGAFSSCEKQNQIVVCNLHLTVSVKGRKITKEIPLRIQKSGSSLTADFVGSFQFTEFGIKPYTAMLGAIAVKNDFYIAASLKAVK